MNEDSFDCVEMKREIQERLRGQRPAKPLSDWNEAVRTAMRCDPHLRRFEADPSQSRGPNARKAG